MFSRGTSHPPLPSRHKLPRLLNLQRDERLRIHHHFPQPITRALQRLPRLQRRLNPPLPEYRHHHRRELRLRHLLPRADSWATGERHEAPTRGSNQGDAVLGDPTRGTKLKGIGAPDCGVDVRAARTKVDGGTGGDVVGFGAADDGLGVLAHAHDMCDWGVEAEGLVLRDGISFK